MRERQIYLHLHRGKKQREGETHPEKCKTLTYLFHSNQLCSRALRHGSFHWNTLKQGEEGARIVKLSTPRTYRLMVMAAEKIYNLSKYYKSKCCLGDDPTHALLTMRKFNGTNGKG